MQIATLAEMSPPPSGKYGWPWTEESSSLPDTMAEGSPWPKVTVVTPSFNQCKFIEQTIRSVLLQGYPNLEYIVIDGGSKDGSIDIIRMYEPWLAYWVSEPDHGQSHAINKGFQIATGEWIGWQNLDDIYYPGVFASLATAAAANPNAHLIIGNMMLFDEHDHELRDIRYVRPTYNALRVEGMVLTNQAAFWQRTVHDQIGFFDEDLECGFDYDWFLRLTQRCHATHVNEIWGGLRLHGDTKTSTMQERFGEEYSRVLKGRVTPEWMKRAYQIRRFFLLLGQGNLKYVARGLYRRLRQLPDDLV